MTDKSEAARLTSWWEDRCGGLGRVKGAQHENPRWVRVPVETEIFAKPLMRTGPPGIRVALMSLAITAPTWFSRGLMAHVGSSLILRGAAASMFMPREGKSFALVNFADVNKSEISLFVQPRSYGNLRQKGEQLFRGAARLEGDIHGDLRWHMSHKTGETSIW